MKKIFKLDTFFQEVPSHDIKGSSKNRKIFLVIVGGLLSYS